MSMDDRETIKKQQRMVDHDRQKYQAAVKAQLQKQSATISQLKKDNDKLKGDVASKTGGSYKFTEQDKAAAQQQEMEALERKVNFEKLRERDLDKKFAVTRMDLTRARKNMGGVNITTENITAIDKQVRVLENRLDQALVQFNEALAYNRDLRQQIDNLRGERKVFTEIYRKLEADLHEKKKAMADIIEQSNNDYEERDKLVGQLEALRSAAKEDNKKYEEGNEKLNELMRKYKAMKDQQRQQIIQQQQAQQQAQLAKSPTKSTKDDSRKEESRKKNTAADTTKSPQDDHLLECADGNAEAEIKWLADEIQPPKTLDELIDRFQTSEEKNFSTYNYINELNAKSDALEIEIAQLEEERRTQRGDTERSAALKALETELAATESRTEAINAKINKDTKTLEEVRKMTQEIFTKINCSTQMAEDLTGTTTPTEITLLTFLGIVEHRATELLFAANRASDQDRKKQRVAASEEKRRRQEQQLADQQARLEAGETVDGDDQGDVGVDDSDAANDTRTQFVGVGPMTNRGQNSAAKLIKDELMPTTNISEVPGEQPHDDKDDDKGKANVAIVDHDSLRADMDGRLERRNNQKKNKGKSKGPK